MKRVSPKKANQLKEIIYLNDLKECSKQTQKSLFRSVLEPVLNSATQGLVLIRCFDTQNLMGLVQRLQFSDIKVYSFCDNLKENSFDNLEKENIWEDTEFIMVLGHRYSAMLIWDYSLSDKKDFCNISLMLNSKKITDVCKMVAQNSMIDFAHLIEDFQPDRRSNETMNEALGKIVDYASELNQEVMMKQVENESLESNFALFHRYEIGAQKIKLVSHEIKNNLSVIDLYSSVIQRRLELPSEESKTSIINALDCINRASSFINAYLLEMKPFQAAKVEELFADEVIASVVELASMRAKAKQVKIIIKNDSNSSVFADKVKLSNVILNLIYNAIDAMSEDNKNPKIEITSTIQNDLLSIQVEDNGSGIEENLQASIFNLEFTTKDTGNGLGLYIARESMKEVGGDLTLVSSDKTGTIFEILVPIANTLSSEEGE